MTMLINSKEVRSSRFFEEISTPNSMMNVNNNPMPRGIYNLIVSKRDVGLFCVGMKPHRNWRIKDVKQYFGLKGNNEKIKSQLEQLLTEYKQVMEQS